MSAWVVEGQMKYNMCSDAYVELIILFLAFITENWTEYTF